jgi:phospho-N-acetylmuramoyl-pentapeptide-transferase
MIKNDIIIPVLIAFFVCLVLSPTVIKYLQKLKFGQFIRDEGPESHLKKSGTPTMGGLIILLGIIVGSIFYVGRYPNIIPILFVTVGFGLIGFIDDYIKVVMKRNLGLRAWQKMLGQIVVTGIFAYYILNYAGMDTTMLIPFSGGKYLEFGVLFVPALFVIVLGTVNGANFTDGLDGLASSVTVLIATFFTVVAIATNAGIEPVTGAAIGALLGFLVFNVYPARVFMGDTGSLALGGFVASTAVVLQMPLFIPIVAFIYLLEVVSVIIQVASFKTTGKRVFKMAPIHHHFELSGWPETKVVSIFAIATAVLCMIGFIAI